MRDSEPPTPEALRSEVMADERRNVTHRPNARPLPTWRWPSPRSTHGADGEARSWRPSSLAGRIRAAILDDPHASNPVLARLLAALRST